VVGGSGMDTSKMDMSMDMNMDVDRDVGIECGYGALVC
jgi:hypothetical protein